MSDPQQWRPELTARLAGLDLDPAGIHQIVEELSQHLDDRYAELLGAGIAPDAARRRVLDELAGRDVLRRAIAAIAPPTATPPPLPGAPAGAGWLSGLTADVRDGLRAFRLNPLLTTVALLTLSVGIGANAAIFSVVNAAILRPLPFEQPDRLVGFWGSAPQMGIPVVNYPDALYLYIRARSRTIQRMTAYAGFTVTLAGSSAEPERLNASLVTGDFFKVLGRTPIAGREFSAAEESAQGEQVAVLSHALWQRRFGGDPQIVGKVLTLDARPVRIVGIMPESFDFPNRSQVWLPLRFDAASLSCWCYSTVGRLAPGRSAFDAAREVAWLTDSFWRERDGKPLRDPKTTDPEAVVVAEPLAQTVVGDVRRPLLILLAAVGMVLAIACANIATLLLARAGARRREIAVRCCLGASPWRIVRQLLVESALLAAAGAAIGIVLASWGAGLLGRFARHRLPHVQEVSVDPTVLIFTAAIALFTVVLFGVVPAWQGSRVELQEAVKDGARTTRSVSSRRLADVFVVAEFAVAIVLLIGAGLLLRSLGNVLRIDPGFQGQNLLVGRVSLPWLDGPAERNTTRARQFFSELTEHVKAVPGVKGAAVASIAPFSDGNNGQLFAIRGREPAKNQPKLVAQVRSVSAGYVATVGMPLLRGRFFTGADAAGAPLVAVVDETLARRFWSDGDAVGHEVRLGDDGPWRTIVGVVASVKHQDLTAAPDRYVYIPHTQQPSVEMDLVVRAASDAAALTPTIRRVIRDMDATLPFYGVHTMDEAVDESLETRRLTGTLLFAFAVAAVVLAVIGIYGVMALAVSRRVHEFGIRLALGASPGDVLSLVLRHGMRLVAVGAAVGIAGALGVTRYLGALLFGVKPNEPAVFAAVVLALVLVAFAACLVPARKATATPPLEALRLQ